MPKFLRKLEFEKVIKALWDTSKSRFIEEVSFDDATQILSQTKDGQTEEVADLTIYAKKDEENHFTESNLFKDVFLETLEPYIDNLGSYTNFAGGVKKTGRRDFTSHSNGNDGYVKSLLIRLSNGMGAGSKTNVSVWEVEKGLTTLDDVANKIVDNVQVDVLEYGGIKYIEVPIYKKYENPTYFMFQILPSADMAYYQSPTNMEDYIYIDGDVAVDGTSIDANKNKQHIGVYGIIGNHIRVRDFLKDYVTEWKDLEYATQSTNFNIFNPSTFEHGKYYNSIGTLASDTNWGNFKIPCSGGDTFTLFKKTHDSINLGLLSGGRWVQNLKVSYNNDNGWVKYTINIPQTGQFDSISIPVHKQTNNYKSGVMLFSGDVQAPAEFIPFTNNRVVSIDGENVAITFDSSGTTLTSGTTVDAIKELDSKIINAGGGTVTSVNGEQPQNGEVTLTATVTQNVGQNIVLVVGNQNNFATLECMTEQEADNIIAGFTL